MRYDGSTDYVNYGYWCDGEETVNPSGKLVELVVSKLDLTSEDIILNVGSGLGQPDVDIVNKFPVKKIIGINISPEQITYANNKFKSLDLHHRIEHRLLNTDQIVETLDGQGITCVIIIEVIAAIANSNKLIQDCYRILPSGGRISFCDSVRIKNRDVSILKRLISIFLLKISSVIYGDHWQNTEEYIGKLERGGFKNIQYEHIGSNIFPCVYRFAQRRFSLLRQRKIPLIPRIGAYLNLRSLDLLFAWNQIDYTLFYAEKQE